MNKITATEIKRYGEDRYIFLEILMELENLGLLESKLENDYELGVCHRVWYPRQEKPEISRKP